MAEKKDKTKEILRNLEKVTDKCKNESVSIDDFFEDVEESRDITKMQAPDSWPAAPENNNDDKTDK